jgi:hypothetical protein
LDTAWQVDGGGDLGSFTAASTSLLITVLLLQLADSCPAGRRREPKRDKFLLLIAFATGTSTWEKFKWSSFGKPGTKIDDMVEEVDTDATDDACEEAGADIGLEDLRRAESCAALFGRAAAAATIAPCDCCGGSGTPTSEELLETGSCVTSAENRPRERQDGTNDVDTSLLCFVLLLFAAEFGIALLRRKLEQDEQLNEEDLLLRLSPFLGLRLQRREEA